MMAVAALIARGSRRFARAREGIAAVEFGLLSPVLLMLLVLMLDFASGFYIKLRIIGATSAAAEYIFQNGPTVSASNFTTFVANVQAVVQTAAGLRTPPSVEVRYNNDLTGSTIGTFSCAAGYAPVVWTSTGPSSSSCGNGVMSGQFVSLTVKATSSTLFQPDPILGRVVNLTETVIVRIK